MPHPQEQELREVLGRFFGPLEDPNEETKSQRIVRVIEPETDADLVIGYRDDRDEDALGEGFDDEEGDVGPADENLTAVVGFAVAAWGTHEQEVARRLGVTPPDPTPAETNPLTGRPVQARPSLECPVDGVDAAVEVVFTAVREFLKVPDDQWLWITDEPEPDQWPAPLPKPDVWPPAPPTGG